MTDVEVNFVVSYIKCEMCRVLWGHISQQCEIYGINPNCSISVICVTIDIT